MSYHCSPDEPPLLPYEPPLLPYEPPLLPYEPPLLPYEPPLLPYEPPLLPFCSMLIRESKFQNFTYAKFRCEGTFQKKCIEKDNPENPLYKINPQSQNRFFVKIFSEFFKKYSLTLESAKNSGI